MKKLLYLFLFLFSLSLSSQNKGPNIEDYQRAQAFLEDNFRQKVYNTYVQPQWFADSTGLWYVLSGKGTRSFKKVIFPDMSPQTAFDHQRLAQVLNTSFDLDVRADSLPMRNLEFKKNQLLGFRIKDQNYAVDLTTYKVNKQEPEEGEARDRFESESPDGKWIAFSRDYNLFVRSTESGEEFQLSTEGHKNYEYARPWGWGDLIEGENGERPRTFWVSWSPDSKKILTTLCDLRRADKMYLLDWSVDSLFRPRLLSYYRGSPGDKNIVYEKPVLFDIEAKKEIPVNIAPKPHFTSANLRWRNDSKSLLGFCYTRGYKELNFYSVEAENGEAHVIYNEKSETSFDYRIEFRILKASRRVIFSSERSGWKHYYLMDVDSGDFTPLTQGNYVVTGIVNVDEKEEQLYFTASGKQKGHNVYLQQLYRVGFDGKKVQRISKEDGHHQLSFSPDGQFFVDNYSSIYHPTKTILRSTKDLQKTIQLSEANPSDLEATGWKPPQTEIVKADDGQTDIYVAMWKPTNFDPAQSYPIIDATYTGPHTFRFPRSYAQALSGNNQSLAELGFVVLTVDGRGSSGRSKAFRAHSYKRLGYGLVDHVHAIKELGKKYSWMNVERVGIFGHSAGGYDAGRGMLLFPDFYKVAVASSGDHDHRMEKAWWPEMYMGWPVDTAYQNQSNITMAGNLQGKLLLVHGGIDENVNPSATFKLSEALIKADKDFDLLIIPSQRHGYRGIYSDYFTKKRWNYFVEHLMGAEPIWSFDGPVQD